jgi:glycerol-3-phosphate dehydrogenase
VPIEPRGRGRFTLADRSLVLGPREHGRAGLITIVATKYTTARATAERAVDAALGALGRSAPASTRREPLYGSPADAGGPTADRCDPRAAAAPSGDAIEARLALLHGSRATALARAFRGHADWTLPLAPGSAALRGEVHHAAREEAALTLGDALRRTGLGAEGLPDALALAGAASIMRQELGWTAAREREELALVERELRPAG